MLCSTSRFAPSKWVRGQLTPNPTFSSKIMWEYTLPTGLKVVNCARHGDCLPLRWAQGASPYFGSVLENVPFPQTICPIQIKFGLRHQGNELSCYAPLLNPPPIFTKIFLWEFTWPNALNLIWGLLEHVEMFSYPRHGDWSPVRKN